MINIPLPQDSATVTIQTWIYRVAAVSFCIFGVRTEMKYSNVGCFLGQCRGSQDTHEFVKLLSAPLHKTTWSHGTFNLGRTINVQLASRGFRRRFLASIYFASTANILQGYDYSVFLQLIIPCPNEIQCGILWWKPISVIKYQSVKNITYIDTRTTTSALWCCMHVPLYSMYVAVLFCKQWKNVPLYALVSKA